MKFALIFLLYVVPTFAQSPSGILAIACGPKDFPFSVTTDSSQHSVEQPEPGKARVYFIQESGVDTLTFGQYPMTTIAVDGAWRGANKRNTYFALSLTPGEHHFCACVRSIHFPEQIQLAHLTVEPGNDYFYRTRLFLIQGLVYLELAPVDSDEARYLIASYPLARSRAK